MRTITTSRAWADHKLNCVPQTSYHTLLQAAFSKICRLMSLRVMQLGRLERCLTVGSSGHLMATCRRMRDFCITFRHQTIPLELPTRS